MTPDLTWWGTWIGLLAVQAAALAGLGAAAELRVRGPQGRRALWQGVLIAVALVWGAEMAGLTGRNARAEAQRRGEEGWPSVSRKVAGGETVGRSDDLAKVGELPSVTTRPSLDEVRDEGEKSRFAVGDEDTGGEAAVLALPRLNEASLPVKWPGWIWLGGTMVLLLRFATGLGCVAFLRRRMKPAGEGMEALVARLRLPLGLRRVCLQVWPGLRGPVAFGIWRPTVALPLDFESRYTPVQGEAMLAHELAHLAARDPFWLALADGIVALAWWHPGVWWARRRLRIAGETAADEASALVPSGPSALAESLVLFGRELAAPGVTRALGVAGNGFRSDLSRRVTALLGHSGSWKRLSAGGRWLPRMAALGMAGGMAMMPARAGFSGSVLAVLTRSTPKQETQVEAVAGSNTGTNTYVVTKAADQADPSAAVTNRAGGSSTNLRQDIYRAEAQRRRGGEEAGPSTNYPPPVVTVATNLNYTKLGHEVIRGKLEHIRLGVVQFEGVPLQDVLKDLSMESRKRDVEGVGINFMINSQPGSISTSRGSVAPPFDIGSTPIKISPPLRDIKLVDVINAVCEVADRPITYTIEDYAVVFVPRPHADAVLITRTFRVDPNTFIQGVQGIAAISESFRTQTNSSGLRDAGTNKLSSTASPMRLHEMIRDYFSAAGANLDPPKNIFFNDRAGLVMVHATEEDINLIRSAIEMLNVPDAGRAAREPGPFDSRSDVLHVAEGAPPVASRSAAPSTSNAAPTVTLVVRFTELPEQGPGDIGLDWLFGQSPTNNPAPRTGPVAELLETTNLTHTENYRVDALRTEGETATLTEAQFRVLIHTLEQKEGVDVLSAPTIKTFSGRKARIEIRAARTIVSAVEARNGSPATKSSASINYVTEEVGTGPMLDVIPVAEGRAWRLTALAGLTEFLGYDKPGKTDEVKVSYGDAKPTYGTKPLPHFRSLEARASALLGAGETMALRGPSFGVTNKIKGGIFRKEKTSVSRKRLYIFVTVQPEKRTAGGGREDSAVIVVVGKAPPFFKIGSKAVTIEEVRAIMQAEVARNPYVKVQIQPDRNAPVGEILKVIEAAKGAKVEAAPALLVREVNN